MLAGLEKKAAEVAQKAGELADAGKINEAVASFSRLTQDFPGTLAARKGGQVLMNLVSRRGAQ